MTALAVVRAAHRKGFRCVLLDSMSGPAANSRLAEFRRLRADDMESLAQRTHDLVERDDVCAVADSDRWLRFVRCNHAALRSRRWWILHPRPEAIDICLDKSAFLKWCAANGLSAPRWYDPSTVLELTAATYPLMLRPEWTQHSSGTGLPKAIEIHDPEGMRYWLQRYATVHVPPSISESLLREGLRQFSVCAARDAAGSVRTFVAEKVRPAAEQCAGGTFVTPAEHGGAADLATRALEALDFFGVAEVEVLVDSRTDRPYLVEINARPWLQYGLPFTCGCDLLGHAIGLVDSHSGKPNRSHAWLYFSSDLYACFSRSTGLVSTGRIGFGEYIRSLASADVYALWHWRDPGPMFASAARTMAEFLKRRVRG